MLSGSKVYFATSCEAEEFGAAADSHPLTAQAADKLTAYLIAGSPVADAAHEFIDILMRAESAGHGKPIAAQVVDWGTTVCERIANL